MLLVEAFDFLHWAQLVDFAGSVVLVGFVLTAIVRLLAGRDVTAVRLTIAEGAIVALSIKTAAALLKTIELRTAQQLAAFTAILVLRIVLKRLFTWESKRLRRTDRQGDPTGAVGRDGQAARAESA